MVSPYDLTAIMLCKLRWLPSNLQQNILMSLGHSDSTERNPEKNGCVPTCIQLFTYSWGILCFHTVCNMGHTPCGNRGAYLMWFLCLSMIPENLNPFKTSPPATPTLLLLPSMHKVCKSLLPAETWKISAILVILLILFIGLSTYILQNLSQTLCCLCGLMTFLWIISLREKLCLNFFTEFLYCFSLERVILNQPPACFVVYTGLL